MEIREALPRVRERVEKAAASAGRNVDEITLMGVSKFHNVKAVEEAYENGIRVFGESRVQEALDKFPAFLSSRPDASLHMIGSLQRNKAKAAAGLFHCVQSLDRDELVEALGRACQMERGGEAGGSGEAGEKKAPLLVLLELHTAEDSKSGYPGLDALLGGAEKIAAYPGLELAGLMTMAPFSSDTKAVRASFRSLYKAGEELTRRGFFTAPVLSMGMSGDFEIAIEEGSTLIRIGTLIFGERGL
ncbi:MAG: YggS family pyridoxal phosphate-dependent enzyme [Spirochaetaceae bacterium]|jgi:pyridoxal phosphate enzyme (YggS family)|nr:YggS family pyridoxal phosphate-dependent enzyme [Spirochaetaceae bacterium]